MIGNKNVSVNVILHDNMDLEGFHLISDLTLPVLPRIGDTLKLILYGEQTGEVFKVIHHVTHDTSKIFYTVHINRNI